MDLATYVSLFLIAFAAATFLPLQSELVVVGLLLAGKQPWLAVVAVASMGNILGSIVNWGLGRSLLRFQDKRWFPASREQLSRAENWYRRYGRGTLLLSWIPVIGDPLTVIAGALREPLWSFALIVGIAKTGRYVMLAALTLELFSRK
jgi:membrane protein YqaA with SNARE-associated domain